MSLHNPENTTNETLHSVRDAHTKLYNNERAVISMTSWKRRISLVGETIFTILTNCPGFHIVLVLSTEEFPNRFDDLPDDLKMLGLHNLIEILWVSQNVKSLKKILYTLERYFAIPVISADDDLYYICNYANELYELWLAYPNHICTVNAQQPLYTNGTATLYYPGCFGSNPVSDMLANKHLNVYCNADDGYYELLRAKYNIPIAYLPPHKIWEDRNGESPLHDIYMQPGYLEHLRVVQSEDLGRPIGL